tara:strand:- start:136330 stop:136689 length:360 start_codon:yes stop_codon:yes gene_type:complete
MPNLKEQLLPLEKSHLLEVVRSDRDRLSSLLHESFTEIGASGGTYTRDDVLNNLPIEPQAKRSLHEFQANLLSPDIAHTTYITTQTDPSMNQSKRAKRSSIWIRKDKTWQLIFHQGTPI